MFSHSSSVETIGGIALYIIFLLRASILRVASCELQHVTCELRIESRELLAQCEF